MKIQVYDDRKLVEISMNNDEQKDETINNSLKPIYKVYMQQKYRVAVFMSGNQDLTALTSMLLRRNRNTKV